MFSNFFSKIDSWALAYQAQMRHETAEEAERIVKALEEARAMPLEASEDFFCHEPPEVIDISNNPQLMKIFASG